MKPESATPIAIDNESVGLLPLAILSLLVGAAAGFSCALFRLALNWTGNVRNALITWSDGALIPGWLIVAAVCGAATALAAALVRRFSPHASGSGIPHVEAVLEGRLPPAGFQLIPVKFVGGVLAMGAGLALGREGPSVQIGGGLGHLIGSIFRRSWPDCRVLFAAGAGAGLATAFNAPIAGAVFVLEEIVRKFETRIAIAALGASAAAIAVARIFLGEAPEFRVNSLQYAGPLVSVIHLIGGLVAGLAAVAYNIALVKMLAAGDRLRHVPVELRAGLIGGCVGILAWLTPEIVGGGEALAQLTFDGELAVKVLPFVFLIRFVLGPLSYAARTPGGLFAPMLVLGAQLGFIVAAVGNLAIPSLQLEPHAFAIVGMAAFFTGVVRAPVTGIVLITEMTGNFTMLLPMLGASFAAMLVPTLLKNPPIYDSLREKPDTVS
jgi:CIC family chloride channel protein